MGNTRELNKDSDDAANLPPGKHSTHALGKLRPNPAGNKKILNDVTVPLGQLKFFGGDYMDYNEYIVYNTN